jgi:uncharacterized protein YodC (DUF2158 family)
MNRTPPSITRWMPKREPEPIGVGSIVRHKAGGPRMFVTAVAGEWAETQWFDTTNRVQTNRFMLTELETSGASLNF